MACTRESTTSCALKIAIVLFVWNIIIIALFITAFVEIGSIKEKQSGGHIKVNESRQMIVHLTGYTSNKGKLNDELLDIWMTGRLGQASKKMTSPGATQKQFNITETGNYFVYAQLYFQISFNTTRIEELHQSYAVFFVCRVSKGKRSILMRSVESNGFHGRKAGLFTSYTGSIQRLRKGDVLYVSVPKKLGVAINTNESSSFFGAFKL